MPAFNRRLAPKEVVGLPLATVVSAIAGFILSVLTLLVPVWIKVLPGLGILFALFSSVYTFRLGDDWPLRTAFFEDRRDRRTRTPEAVELL